jgi:hypothetical protein
MNPTALGDKAVGSTTSAMWQCGSPTVLANSDNTRTALVRRPYGSQQAVESASTTLRQTDFAKTPISIAGGMGRVKDEVTIEFDIAVAGR